MGRLLQLIALLLLIPYVWRALARWLGGVEPPQVEGRRGKREPIYRGQMVRDPVCGVFLPRERSIEDRRDAEVRYFCSQKCREAFRTSAVPVNEAK